MADELQSRLERLERKVEALERNAIRQTNIRFAMIRYAQSYLASADLDGDYCEFGVGLGETFAYAVRVLAQKQPALNFYGYDTFMGMPDGLEQNENLAFKAGYSPGQFRATLPEVENTVFGQNPRVDRDRIHFVPGLFAQTLRDSAPGPEKVAIAFIDAIYYEPVKEVLNFITKRICQGSLLLFDDWRSFRNLPGHGSQRACREWLEQNRIRLAPCFPFGGIGQSFTIL